MSSVTAINNSSINIPADLAEKKSILEELGYLVEQKSTSREWVVRPPKGVHFLTLPVPDKPVYVPFSKQYETDDERITAWEALPEERRFCDGDPRMGAWLYKFDPDADTYWQRQNRAFERLNSAFVKVAEESGNIRAFFEKHADECEVYDDACNYYYDKINASLRWLDDGRDRMRSMFPIFICRKKSAISFRSVFLEGFRIDSLNEFGLNEFESYYRFPIIDDLPTIDPEELAQIFLHEEKELAQEFLRNQNDLIVSTGEEQSEISEVEFLLPGLVERGGMTVTYAPEKRGKTALVMAETWLASQRGDCNVIYLSFEGHNGLNSRFAALENHYGPSGEFVIKKAHWNLSERKEWADVRRVVSELKKNLSAIKDAPTIVVFDTVGAALGTGSRITGAPEIFLGEVKNLQRECDVAAWLIAHENKQGDLYGFSGFKFDADIVTRITGRSDSTSRNHTRRLARHLASNTKLCSFRLLECGPSIVADFEEAKRSYASSNSVEPEENSTLQPDCVAVLDEAGAVDGLTEDELREVLNGYIRLQNPEIEGGALRQRRFRIKNELIDQSQLRREDERYYLVV